MSSLLAPKCPNCGAPLELHADRTCVWCHSVVAVDPGPAGDPATAERDIEAQEARAFDALVETWTLRPDGPQIDWSAGFESDGTATRRLLNTLRDGLGQPAAQELAADADLDREFCTMVGRAMALMETEPVCDVVDALIVSPGTDPGWAAKAGDAVKPVRKLLAERKKMDGRMLGGTQPEATPPHLAAWVQAKMQSAPKHRHRW
jgi:hypothetical protein